MNGYIVERPCHLNQIENGRWKACAVLCSVLSAFNLFNQDMVKFYLEANSTRQIQVLQYPELPIDAFKPDFNVTELVKLCQENKVKYVLLYEYGGDVPYFQSNLNAMQVYILLNDSGNFTSAYRVGTSPRTITIFSFS